MSPQPRTKSDLQHQPNLVVELFRDTDEERFSCTLSDWNFIRDLGTTFGWHSAGTTYLPQLGQRMHPRPMKHDYQPGDSKDSKRVEANDSLHWVVALEGARRSPFIAGMLRARASQQDAGDIVTEESQRAQLQNFITFARRGAFTIALRRQS